VPIELGAGTFYLEEPVEIRRPITLVGQGMDETEIVSEAELVVEFSGDGPFVVEDITFRHDGRNAADVVVVRKGEVSFSECRFTGGVYDEDVEDIFGAGLVLKGSTEGTVRENVVEENGGPGVVVEDRAEPKLEGNTITENEGIGLFYWDNAGGVARENDCSWNAMGIVVGLNAEPTLEENTCTNNEGSGIMYYGMGGGDARRNECYENDGSGILVGLLSEPTLEENVCRDNKMAGISYSDESGGVARGNECSGNLVGIYVEATANPELIDNDCHGNSGGDILDGR
jgi:parallel beta-helix repeat protein